MLRAAPSAPDSAAPSSLSAEPIYQITACSGDPKHVWRDASEKAFDFHMPEKRRIVYAAPPAQAPAAPDHCSVDYSPACSNYPNCACGKLAQAPAIQAPLTAGSVEAIEAGHDPFCMSVLRGKECDCGKGTPAIQAPEAVTWQKRHAVETEGTWETCSKGDFIFWATRPGWETRALCLATPSAAVSAEPDHTPDPEIPITRSLLVAAVGELAKYALPAGADDQVIANLATACGIPVPSAAVSAGPVALEFDDYPDFHDEAMGCGLEDRGIRDRYEAMRYGWDQAMERVGERIAGFLENLKGDK
jgi:hypothetical protein